MVRSLQLFLYMAILLLVINIHTSSSQGDFSETFVSNKECDERLKKLDSTLQERIINLETNLQERIKNLETINKDVQARIQKEVILQERIQNLETVNRDLQERIKDLEGAKGKT